MVQVLIGASNGHALFTTLLRLNASLVMAPRVSSHSLRNLRNSPPVELKPKPPNHPSLVLRPKTTNRPSMVLRPKPPNCPPMVLTTKQPNPTRKAYPPDLLHSIDTCHHHPQSPDHQVLQHLCLTWSTTILTWSTRSTPLHVLLLVQSFGHRPSWSLGTAPSPSAQHVSTWPSPCLSIVSVLHTCTPTQLGDMLHTH